MNYFSCAPFSPGFLGRHPRPGRYIELVRFALSSGLCVDSLRLHQDMIFAVDDSPRALLVMKVPGSMAHR